MSKAVFPIESAAHLINQIVVNRAHVGARKCIISAVVLNQAESCEGVPDRRRGTDETGDVVNSINVIFVCEIVIHPECSQITS